MNETVVTQKGTTTIPQEIRQALGIATGATLVWSVRAGVIEARKKADAPNALQQKIRLRAGTWDGEVTGEELLRRTRP